MYNKTAKTTDIVGAGGMNRRTTVLSRGAGLCCPFLNSVRYHKTESLKDEEVFFELNGGQTEKKRMMKDQIKENPGTSMMYYL